MTINVPHYFIPMKSKYVSPVQTAIMQFLFPYYSTHARDEHYSPPIFQFWLFVLQKLQIFSLQLSSLRSRNKVALSAIHGANTKKSELNDSKYEYNILLCYHSLYNTIDDKLLGMGPSSRATGNNVVV
jgi:hypothetical protein